MEIPSNQPAPSTPSAPSLSGNTDKRASLARVAQTTAGLCAGLSVLLVLLIWNAQQSTSQYEALPGPIVMPNPTPPPSDPRELLDCLEPSAVTYQTPSTNTTSSGIQYAEGRVNLQSTSDAADDVVKTRAYEIAEEIGGTVTSCLPLTGTFYLEVAKRPPSEMEQLIDRINSRHPDFIASLDRLLIPN